MERTLALGDGAARSRRRSIALPHLNERWGTHIMIASILAVLVTLALKLGNFTAFYSVDGAIKYLAAISIAPHPTNPSIPYPFRRFDPTGQYTLPLTAWYNGHDYAGYSLPFEYLTGACLRLFGAAGIIAPPIIGTGLLLYVQAELATIVGLRGSRALLLITTVATTPILFYSLAFWEHTWGVALLLAGVAVLLQGRGKRSRSSAFPVDNKFIVNRALALAGSNAAEDEDEWRHGLSWQALAAGGLFAGAVLMRRETVIPAMLAIGILPLVFRSKRMFVACALAAVALIVPIGAIMFFHPEPLAVGLSHASPGRAAVGVKSAAVNYVAKLQYLASGGYATVLFLVFTAAVPVVKRFRPNWLVPMLAVGSAVLGLAFTVSVFHPYSISNENLLAFCPLAIWGVWSILLVPWRRKESAAVVALWALAVGGFLRWRSWHSTREASSGGRDTSCSVSRCWCCWRSRRANSYWIGRHRRDGGVWSRAHSWS